VATTAPATATKLEAAAEMAPELAAGAITIPEGVNAAAAPSGTSLAEGAETGESRRPVGGAGGDAIGDWAVGGCAILRGAGAIPGDAAGPCAAAQAAAARSARRTKATRAISISACEVTSEVERWGIRR
jgi:hypothetical protein